MYIYMYIHNYSYIIMFVCVCVCVCDDRTAIHVDRLAGIRDLMRLQMGVRRSRLVTFAPLDCEIMGSTQARPGQKVEARFLLHSHPDGGEGVSTVQGEATRRR